MNGFWSRRRFSAYLILFLLGMVLQVSGCGELTSPADTDGEKLSGTQDVGRHAFSVSRGGQYLFYPTKTSTDADLRYALYRIDAKSKTIVTADPSLSERVQRYIPWYRRGCWGRGEDRHRVYLSTGSTLFYVDARADELASHTSWPFYTETVHLTDESYSPDGRYFAYGISEAWGSFFGDAQGYVLDVKDAQGPYRLGKAMFGPVRWGPDARTLYGKFEVNGTAALYRWRIEDLMEGRR